MVTTEIHTTVGRTILSFESQIPAWTHDLLRPTSLLAAMQAIAEDKATRPVLERLEPPQRAAVIMALVAITLVGLFLIVLAILGGHWTRRLARQRPSKNTQHGRTSVPTDTELRKSLESILPEAKTDDTIQFGKSSPDTKVGN